MPSSPGRLVNFLPTVTLEILVCEPGLREGPQRNPERGLRFLPVFQVGQGTKLLLHVDLRQGGAGQRRASGLAADQGPGPMGSYTLFFLLKLSRRATSDNYLHFAPHRKMSLLVWRLAQ